MIKKGVVFIDANNLYHNVKHWFKPSDIDIVKVIEKISKEKSLEVLEIRWYVSVPNIEDDKIKYMRHMAFLSNLEKKGIKVFTRKLQKLSNKELRKKREDFIQDWDLCSVCKPIVEKSFLDISNYSQKEKGIDVLIAVDMLKESRREDLDLCLLISGDADFIPAFDLVIETGKDVLVAFVPRGYSNELRQKFEHIIFDRSELSKCLRKKDE